MTHLSMLSNLNSETLRNSLIVEYSSVLKNFNVVGAKNKDTYPVTDRLHAIPAMPSRNAKSKHITRSRPQIKGFSTSRVSSLLVLTRRKTDDIEITS